MSQPSPITQLLETDRTKGELEASRWFVQMLGKKESTLQSTPPRTPDTALRDSKTPKCLELLASVAAMCLTKGI